MSEPSETASFRADVLDFSAQRMNNIFGNGARPQLAFDDPTALESELLEGDVHVNVLRTTRTGHGTVPCPSPDTSR